MAVNWLLLRGLTHEAGHWSSFPKKIEATFPGHKVQTLDLPGVGSQLDVNSPARIEEITDMVKERWQHIEPSDNGWGIIGLSLGGMVAIDWTTRYPE